MPINHITAGDCLDILRAMPDRSVDLVFTSSPYEAARTYGVDFNLRGQEFVDWCFARYVECCRVSRGLVAWVIEGQTRNYRYSAAPALLMADLHRAGINLRKPPIFSRVGIPGSGGPDWLRNDWEFIICATPPGKLLWSDNTAMGHPPKWGPGGAMSNRHADGQRKNAGQSQRNPRIVAQNNRLDHICVLCLHRQNRLSSCPTCECHWLTPVAELDPTNNSHKRAIEFVADSIAKAGFTNQWGEYVSAKKMAERDKNGKRRKRLKPSHRPAKITRGKSNGDTQTLAAYDPPVKANPGNEVQQKYEFTAKELAALLSAEPGDVLRCIVGGGVMGSKLCHENEAPFPEALAEFFIRSFCRPGGTVLDPFCGSGTTCAVAKRHGRNWIGIDIRQSQVELTRRRLAEVVRETT